MQQEVRFIGAGQRIDHLLVVAGAQRGDHEALGLASGEERRAVGARQEAGFAHNRTHRGGVTAIDPLAGFHDIAAQNRAFELLQSRAEVFIGQLLFGECFFDRGFCCRNRSGALLLVGDRVSGADFVLAHGFHGGEEVGVIRRLEVERLFGGIFGQINDQVDHRLDAVMGEFHRAKHFFFGQLIGFRFHHHHGVFGACHNQIETLLGVVAQLVHVFDFGVEDVFAIDKTDAGAGDRTHERRARNGQSRRSRDHRNHIRVVDQIVAQHGAHHQNFVLEARNKQRADRTVDQTRGQRLFFRRTRFAFEETAGHFTRGIVFLLVVNRQREEVLPRFLLLGERYVGHDRGLAQCGDDGAVGLTGNLARFQCQLFFAPLDGFFHFVEHLAILIGSTPDPCRVSRLHGGPIAADLFIISCAKVKASRLRYRAHTGF